MKYADKQFHQYVIEEQTAQYDDEIPEKLYFFGKFGSLKNDKHTEVKTNRKRHQKRKEQCRNMRRNRNRSNMQYLLFQNKIVDQWVENDAQQKIAAAASRVIKRLLGHNLSEQRIEKIQKSENRLLNF